MRKVMLKRLMNRQTLHMWDVKNCFKKLHCLLLRINVGFGFDDVSWFSFFLSVSKNNLKYKISIIHILISGGSIHTEPIRHSRSYSSLLSVRKSRETEAFCFWLSLDRILLSYPRWNLQEWSREKLKNYILLKHKLM